METIRRLEAKQKICLELTNPSFNSSKKRIEQLHHLAKIFIINQTHTMTSGPKLIIHSQSYGNQILYNANLDDNIEMMENIISTSITLGVNLITIKCSNNSYLLNQLVKFASNEAFKQDKFKPKLIGTLSKYKKTKNKKKDKMNRIRLAQFAQENGIDGIICQSDELKEFRTELPRNFKLFVSYNIQGFSKGIRPYNLINDGADYIMVNISHTNESQIINQMDGVINDVIRAL